MMRLSSELDAAAAAASPPATVDELIIHQPTNEHIMHTVNNTATSVPNSLFWGTRLTRE